MAHYNDNGVMRDYTGNAVAYRNPITGTTQPITPQVAADINTYRTPLDLDRDPTVFRSNGPVGGGLNLSDPSYVSGYA